MRVHVYMCARARVCVSKVGAQIHSLVCDFASRLCDKYQILMKKLFFSVADKGETLDKDEFLQFVEGFDWKTEDTIKNELRKDFECFDKNKSGYLDQSELKDILTKYGVENLTDEEVAEFLDAIDKNSDGRINLDGSVETFLI